MKHLLFITALTLMFSGLIISCNNAEKKTENTEQTEQTAAVKYACPMHPEVTSDSPGKCSICEMPLEEVKQN